MVRNCPVRFLIRYPSVSSTTPDLFALILTGNSTHVATAAAGAERMSTQYVLPGGIIDYYELLGVSARALSSLRFLQPH